MRKKVSHWILIFLTLSIQASLAQTASLIEDIKIFGNKRISNDTVRFYLRSQKGRPLDQKLIQQDFRALYKLGAFDDIKIEEQTSDTGVTLIFDLEERPLIGDVQYKGVDQPFYSRLSERLAEKKIDLRVNSYYDPAKVAQAEKAIREFFSEYGYPLAQVRCVKDEVNPAAVKLTFTVDKGPEVKIGHIDFVGNRTFSIKQLRKQMKLTKQKSFLPSLTKKDAYHQKRLEEDLKQVALFYQEHGRARVQIKEPTVEFVDAHETKWFPVPGRHKTTKQVALTIPVAEGGVYKVDQVRLSGTPTSYGEEIDRILAELQPGDVYNAKKLQQAYDEIKKTFSSRGYMVLDPSLVQDFNDDKNLVGVDFRLNETYPFYVRRIEFVGNKRIQDKILRRQMLLNEGDSFSEPLLDRSLVKLNQLDFFERIDRKNVDIKIDKENREVDLIVAVKEKGRQGIWLNGGSGGLGGGYAGIVYMAMNLLGLGELMRLETSGGPRNSSFVFDFLTHSLLDTRISLGLSVFRRFFDFDLIGSRLDPTQALTRVAKRSAGASLSGSYPLSEVSKVSLSYQTEGIHADSLILGSSAQRVSRRALTPAYTYNTTDNYFNPSKGQALTVSTALSGGLLGGGVNVVSPTFEHKFFAPDPFTSGRNTFAFRSTFAHAAGFGGREVPFYERFFSDGYMVRGFDVGEMTPLSFYQLPNGSSQTFGVTGIGGDTLAVFNAEYRVPIKDPVSFVYFFDAGIISMLRHPQTFASGQNLSLIRGTNALLRASTGGELQLQLPVVNKPLRLIFALNPFHLNKSFVAPNGQLLHFKEPKGKAKFALGRNF